MKLLTTTLLVSMTALIANAQSNGYGSDTRAKLKAEIQQVTSALPFDMPDIDLPQIPEKFFNIVDYGARGDGIGMNTAAIQKTIDACASAGGGTVTIPRGIWMTGPIMLKSNVNLHLDLGALVEFSRNHNDYPIINAPRRGWIVESPLIGIDLENVAITGPGLLDGNGITWRPVKKEKVSPGLWKALTKSGGVVTPDGSMWWPTDAAAKGEEYLKTLKSEKNKKLLTAEDFLPGRDFARPMLVLLINCRKILIDGPTFENSPSYALYPNWCEDLVIRNVKVNNEYWAQNGDGIDISSCKGVVIYNSTVTAGDDGICMKSSPDKNSAGPTLKNVVISGCVVYHAHGGFVIGSNIDGGMENISVRNCDFVGTDIGLRFKSARGKGAVVKNIYVSNIFMKDIVNEAILFDTYYEGFGPGEGSSPQNVSAEPVNERTPVFRDFHIDSVYCDGAEQAVHAYGLPEMPLQNVSISNSVLAADKGFDSRYVSGFQLKNVRIFPMDKQVYSLYESKDVTIEKGFCPAGTEIFMTVSGSGSGNITVIDTPLDSAKTPIRYADDANKNAVIQK